MKCPYQTIVFHKTGCDYDDDYDTKDVTVFGDCWKRDCPFYYNVQDHEYCQRAESEVVKK